MLNLSGIYDFKSRAFVGWTDEINEFTATFSIPGPSVTVGQIGTFTDWQVRSPDGKAIGVPRTGTISLFFWDRPMLLLTFAKVVSDPASGHAVILRITTNADSSTSVRTPAGVAFGPPLTCTIWLEFWDGRPY